MTTEDAAVEYVIACDREDGRVARDTRRARGVADVESDGRLIEVKGFGPEKFAGTLMFTPPQVLKAEQDANYYVYIVVNIGQGDPAKFQLSQLHGDSLRDVMAGAKVHRLRVAVPAAAFKRGLR